LGEEKYLCLLFVNRGVFVIPEEDVCNNYHIKRKERVFAMIYRDIIVMLNIFDMTGHNDSPYA
jgi:hypothetical protein